MRQILTILGWGTLGAASGGLLGGAAPAGFSLGGLAGLLLGLFDWELARRRRAADRPPAYQPAEAARPEEFDPPVADQ